MFGFFRKKRNKPGTADYRSAMSSEAQAPYMILVQMQGGEEIAHYKVFDGNHLGKDLGADIFIDDMYCARHQCIFFLQDSRWYIRSETHDTFVNGQWIHKGETAALSSGSELRFSLMKDTFIFRQPQ